MKRKRIVLFEPQVKIVKLSWKESENPLRVAEQLRYTEAI